MRLIHGPVYVTVRRGDVSTTEELEDGTVIVDRDSSGLIIGIEFLKVICYEAELCEFTSKRWWEFWK